MAGFGTSFLSSAVKQTYAEVEIKKLFDCEVLIALDLVVQPHFILIENILLLKLYIMEVLNFFCKLFVPI